jgi:prolyl oligopeptidase
MRPELFGCGVIACGVLDMLRFHLFTVGKSWTSDYGNPDDPAHFAYLATYSPLHNIRADAAYPPVLVLTADHDDRVSPLHSYKYVNALQHAARQRSSKTPVICAIKRNAGHGHGVALKTKLDEVAAVYTFIAATLNLTFVE